MVSPEGREWLCRGLHHSDTIANKVSEVSQESEGDRMPKIPFEYSAFWDVPRFIRCKVDGTELLLESEFDDSHDEYSSEYKVYILPPGLDWAELRTWTKRLSSRANYLGSIHLSQIEFASIQWKELESEPLRRMLHRDHPNLT
jgi:hypothetical protein